MSLVAVSRSLELAQCSTGLPLSLFLYFICASVTQHSSIYCTVLYTLYFIVTIVVVVAAIHFFANQITTKLFFLFLLLSNSIFTLALLYVAVTVTVALSIPYCVRTYIHELIIHTVLLYTNSTFFCVCKIFCRHGDKNRSIHVNINKNILEPHGSIIITIIAFGSRLAEFFYYCCRCCSQFSFISRLLFLKHSTIYSVEGHRMLLNVQEVRKVQI